MTADLASRLREAKELTFNLFWEVAEHLNVEADGRLRQLTAARAWESAAVALCERSLPGWWWRVGTCHVSDDATVGPDYNSPVHGERLHREFPPKKLDDGWDEWIVDIDQRPPRSVALALCLAILTAKESNNVD